MDYDEEKRMHRVMIVVFILVILGFVGYYSWQNSKAENTQEPAVTTEATVEPTIEPEQE